MTRPGTGLGPEPGLSRALGLATSTRAAPALEIAVTVPRRGFNVAVDLRIEPGERLALFGPSGAGKTTVVDASAGLVDPVAGAVRLGDLVLSRPVAISGAARRRLRSTLSGTAPPAAAVDHVSVVRQPPALFPHLDVAANVSYGRSDARLAVLLIARLGLAGHRSARPARLSGGQAQRVALARALTRHFSVLLLDEPVSALDAATRADCYELISERCEEEGAIAVLVTHDLHEAQAFGNRIAVMDAGAVLAVGDPHQIVAVPRTRRVAELVGYRSFLRLRPAGPRNGSGPSTGSSGGQLGGGQVELALDTTSLQPCDVASPHAALTVRGRVASCRPAGPKFLLSVLVPADTPVVTALSGEWVTALTCELPVLLTSAVTVGKEMLATAPTPLVVVT